MSAGLLRQDMSYKTLCRLIAAGTVLSVLFRWKAFSIGVAGFGQGGLPVVMGALGLVTLALALASSVGMWNARAWGFIAFYVFGVLFTFVFGASLIPFVPLLLPAGTRIVAVLVINGIVLALVAMVHRSR